MACCPAHADKNPSLSVSEGEGGRVLLKCFAGCPSESVVAAMGLKLADLMPERAPTDRPARRKSDPFSLAGLKPGAVWNLGKKPHVFVEWYDYKNASGAITYRKLRFREQEGPGKTFLQCVPTDNDKWLFGRSSHGVADVLYRLPAVIQAASAGGEAWVVEGEKDVASAERLGLVATCNADGAGKWSAAHAAALKGCSMVWVIADNDAGPDPKHPKREYWQGQRHATEVVESLGALGVRCQALTLPEVGGFAAKDLTDWVLAHGLGADPAAMRAELMGIAQAAPAWPTDTYRRPLREEPSALPLAAPTASDAARTARSPKPSAALNLNAAGGMPSSSAGEGAASAPPATPHISGATNVGGEGPQGDDETATVAYLRGKLIEIMTDKDASGLQKKRAMANAVCMWLGRRGQFFFDDKDRGHGTAMWFDAVDKKLHRVRQDYFRSWLSKATAFSREFRDYKMFVSAVEDEALIGESTRGITPQRYWQREGDAIYLSCGEGRMVRVSAAAVEIVDNGTDGIVFEQGFTLDPWELLPEADGRDPFASCSVFSGISTVDGRGLMLVRLWFFGMFGVTGWKPLLVLSGDVGSGKTRVATAMFQLLGMIPRVTGIDALGNIKDFWASVDKGGLFCLDNADHHITWLPDALSVIATGGTFEKKKLYTDTDTVTQQSRCWAVVTSANPSFAADAGLSDRLITVLLQRVDRDTAESVLTREIDKARNAGLTWICHVMRRALADTEAAPKAMNRRHPDWAAWVWRLGRAAGMGADAEAAIRENESFKSLFAVQNDAFGKFILSGVRAPFKGSAKDLSQHLATACEGFDPEFWTDAQIGKALKRLSVPLKSLYGFVRLNHSGLAIYMFGPLVDPAAADNAARDLLSPAVVGDVGDVGDKNQKSPVNNSYPDFYPFNPNIPHIPPHHKFVEQGRQEENLSVVYPTTTEQIKTQEASWDSL